MDQENSVSLMVMREKLELAIKGIGVLDLPLDEARLSEFCRLTGHDYETYQKRGEAPVGFFMTFTDPVLSRMFLDFFLKNPKMIKGVIHTKSRIDFKKPIKPDGTYTETIAVAGIKEKLGSKGRYFAVDFEINLMDGPGESVACDIHQYFLKV
jgi:hypothetical protein